MNNYIMAVVLLLIAGSYYFINPVFVNVAQNVRPEVQNFSDEAESSFNLWWLVPLMLIPPILYFLARAGEEGDGYDNDEGREFMPGINTGQALSKFEKNAMSQAYFSEIKGKNKKKKTSASHPRTYKKKKT
jgi:hypothetical protein